MAGFWGREGENSTFQAEAWSMFCTSPPPLSARPSEPDKTGAQRFEVQGEVGGAREEVGGARRGGGRLRLKLQVSDFCLCHSVCLLQTFCVCFRG